MILRHHIHALALSALSIAFAVAASGCSADTPLSPDVIPADELTDVTLSFDLSPMTSGTALNPDNHEEAEASEAELRMFFGDFCNLYVLDGDNGSTVLHRKVPEPGIMNGSAWLVSNADGTLTAHLRATNLERGKRYFLAMSVNTANPNGIPFTLAHSYNDESTLHTPFTIPYSAFRSFTLADDIEPNSTVNVGKLWLLRALSRIDVELSDTLSKHFEIKSIKLLGIGKKLMGHNFTTPAFVNIKEAGSTDALTMAQMFNPVTDTSLLMNYKSDDVPFYALSKRASRIYLPEQYNPLPSGQEIVIAAEFIESATSRVATATLLIRPYVNGKPSGTPYNLVRNHIYRYTINSISFHESEFGVNFDIAAPGTNSIVVPPFE